MEFDAFSARLGESQGRIRPMDGEEFVFVLGDREAVYFHELTTGDYAEVVQETDLTDVDFVRAEMTLCISDSLPAGFAWEVSIIIDGTKFARAACPTGRTRVIADLAANVSKTSGGHSVGVRLALIEF